MSSKKRSTLQIIRTGIVSLIFLVLVAYYITNNYIWKTPVSNEEIFSSTVKTPHSYVVSYLLSNSKSETFNGEKLVHLDLKGAPPLVSYLKKFFPFIKKSGATGVLIEYEDMFYYKGELEDLRAYNSYTPSDIQEILKLAELNKLMVVPLVQTFGHLEFALKTEKFRKLREVEDYPQALCPSEKEALLLVKQMIDQVLEAHPQSKYIHIGCDEVIYLGQCSKCKSAVHENFWTRGDLFLNHVKNVAMYINETYPGVRPIVWHDMISSFSETILKKSKISTLVDLMVWEYGPNISNSLTVKLFEMVARVFKTIWIASAFKGASGPNQLITDARYHLANHVAWLKIVENWKSSINFKGIALTGWQRYDHFAELCELIPIAIPSLAASLLYINNAELGISESNLYKLLECSSPYEFSPLSLKFPVEYAECSFPGFQVFDLILKLHELSLNIEYNFSGAAKGWVSVYNVLHNFSNTGHVKSIFYKWSLRENHAQLLNLEVKLKEAFSEVYDEYTIDEWLTNHLVPLRIRVQAFITSAQELSERKVWPRRPFISQIDTMEKTAEKICTSKSTYGCALLSN